MSLSQQEIFWAPYLKLSHPALTPLLCPILSPLTQCSSPSKVLHNSPFPCLISIFFLPARAPAPGREFCLFHFSGTNVTQAPEWCLAHSGCTPGTCWVKFSLLSRAIPRVFFHCCCCFKNVAVNAPICISLGNCKFLRYTPARARLLGERWLLPGLGCLRSTLFAIEKQCIHNPS